MKRENLLRSKSPYAHFSPGRKNCAVLPKSLSGNRLSALESLVSKDHSVYLYSVITGEGSLEYRIHTKTLNPDTFVLLNSWGLLLRTRSLSGHLQSAIPVSKSTIRQLVNAGISISIDEIPVTDDFEWSEIESVILFHYYPNGNSQKNDMWDLLELQLIRESCTQSSATDIRQGALICSLSTALHELICYHVNTSEGTAGYLIITESDRGTARQVPMPKKTRVLPIPEEIQTYIPVEKTRTFTPLKKRPVLKTGKTASARNITESITFKKFSPKRRKLRQRLKRVPFSPENRLRRFLEKWRGIFASGIAKLRTVQISALPLWLNIIRLPPLSFFTDSGCNKHLIPTGGLLG